jgi:hypothetical protein
MNAPGTPIISVLTCQRLIFRLYRGANPEKCDVIASPSRTGCRHTSLWQRQYGGPKHQHGRRKSTHMLLWQRQYKQQHGRYGINDLLYIADTASHEH